jgi:hypothetical protein
MTVLNSKAAHHRGAEKRNYMVFFADGAAKKKNLCVLCASVVKSF